MTSEEIFTLTTLLAMGGWLLLLISPIIPVWSDRIAGFAIPIALSVVYTALVLATGMGDGDYGDLAGVTKLLGNPEGALSGWLHFLAFDLWLGAWMCRTARAHDMRFWLVLPCLALTFAFGPIGFLLFTVLRGKGWTPAVREVNQGS